MAAITTIPAFYVTEFARNWLTLAEQKDSRLEGTVMKERVAGKEKRLNQIGKTEMQRIVGRAQETRITDIPTDARWLSPYPHDDAKVFDRWDEEFLGEVVLPTSTVMQQMVAGYKRALDFTILTAAVADSRTGADGTTTTALPAGQLVAVNYVETGSTANSGLTIAKLRQAKYIFDVADIDDEDRYLAYSAKQLNDLLRTTEVTNEDYNTIKALVKGDLDTFLGFQFKRVSASLLPYVSATDVRTAVAYVKSGISLTDTGLITHMDVRADLSHALQIRIEAAFGATRTEEVKVVSIACDESP